MKRWLPPLNALRAFEAVARQGSITRAAGELNVTQGAVSQHLKSLEAALGQPLFHRQGRRLVLAPAGKHAYLSARDALDRLSQDFSALRRGQTSSRLTVSISPNFAAKWLAHRIGRFGRRHPSVDLRISASLHHVDFASEDIDMAVRDGLGDWPDLEVTKLADETLFPVCAPRLAAQLRAPEDLAHVDLLHLDDRADWLKWLEAAGASTSINLRRGPVLDQASYAIDAAVDGQGVALARTMLAAGDLLSGRLVKPFATELAVPFGYWIVMPKAAAGRQLLRDFRDWLLQEAAEELAQLATARPGQPRRA